MGFNNGYDSGYSDCEAENRKRWEREAVERYKAENPPSGGGSSDDISPGTPIDASSFDPVNPYGNLGDVLSVSGLTSDIDTGVALWEQDFSSQSDGFHVRWNDGMDLSGNIITSVTYHFTFPSDVTRIVVFRNYGAELVFVNWQTTEGHEITRGPMGTSAGADISVVRISPDTVAIYEWLW